MAESVRSVKFSKNGVNTTDHDQEQVDILLAVVNASMPTKQPIEQVGHEKCEIETTRSSRKISSEMSIGKKNNESHRLYVEAHKEELREKQRIWTQKNKDRIKIQRKEYLRKLW